MPDSALDKDQYQRGELPGIAKVHAIGDFQAHFGKTNGTPDALFEVAKPRKGENTKAQDRKGLPDRPATRFAMGRPFAFSTFRVFVILR